ncbi:hypothetical protein E2I00_014285 [Balaenoptera physalus]|uniref:Uncharacterized protein n=1 Tax=Balaenoptera physalus TaxID=9770 RepID=A0A643BPE9_BALPH|nr:hypothetical protein E2I00_014285 [Balaenoptera physalus]
MTFFVSLLCVILFWTIGLLCCQCFTKPQASFNYCVS